jgi:hypothetical protein
VQAVVCQYMVAKMLGGSEGKKGMNESLIRTRRIELVDDRGNLTAVLYGGETEDGARGFADVSLYSPEGPNSAATITMHGETGNPAIHLYTVGGASIIITFTEDGRPAMRAVTEDGTSTDIVP